MSYAQLSLLILIPALVVGAAAWTKQARMKQNRTGGRSGSGILAAGLSLVVIMVATVFFDNLMIQAGLFGYGEHTLAGIYLGVMPIEDLSYPLAAVILLPSLWVLLTPAGKKMPNDHDVGTAQNGRSGSV